MLFIHVLYNQDKSICVVTKDIKIPFRHNSIRIIAYYTAYYPVDCVM